MTTVKNSDDSCISSRTGMTRRSVLTAAVTSAAAALSRPLLARQSPASFHGKKAGEARDVDGVRLCWCPPGRFAMGSPRDEPERRPGEDQVEVTLTRGFWMAKYEATQGQWNGSSGSCRAS